MSEDFADLDSFKQYLSSRNNWDRWPDAPEAGAVALIDDSKRAQAAALIRSGRSVSLSRPFPVKPSPANPKPAQHYVQINNRDDGSGGAVDYLGIDYHGYEATHLDALCHVWDEETLMWGGRRPESVLTTSGARWGGVEQWRHGIFTRALVADIPALRSTPFVDLGSPIEASEIEASLKSRGLTAQPGDALIVHGGRRAFDEAYPNWRPATDSHPGLAPSCVRFLRENDISVLCWDMVDAMPNHLQSYRTVHRIIHAFGMAIVDNCDLTGIAELARDEQRFECALLIAPLYVVGGTGSPVNPIALL
jgi:kynurenine formamidase